MTNTLLSFKNITIRHHNKIIFKGLNFTISKNEHWAIIGKSGSGKSVLLDALAGRASFPAGEARYPILDEYLKQHGSNDPLFNMHKLIAQVSSRHHFTNLSNTTDLYYQQRFNSMDSEDSQTVSQYLAEIKSCKGAGYWTFWRTTSRLKLTHLLDKQLIKLSNGETKRTMLAAALLRNPLLLLLDNPLTGLDVAARADFNELVGEIAAGGTTVVMATSPGEIPDAITHVAMLDEGRTKQMEKREFATKSSSVKPIAVNADELEDLLSTSQMPDYAIIAKMQNVTIRYGDKTILENVSWQINQGERWVLLGANGAGKSTLLSLINGDNPQAFANKIILFDRVKGSGESIWEIKQKIGFVSPELFQYFPSDSSCIQVVESGFYDTLGLFRRSGEKRAALCLRWMRLLQIDQFATTSFKSASVSVQRLCLLARALVKSPPLLIFDEPCQGMDNEQQERFRYLVDEICRMSKVSLIYVSHYEAEKPACVTRVLHLEEGRVK